MSGYDDDPGRRKKKSIFDMDNGFATTLAFMIAILASPALNEFTVPYVILIAQRSYQPDFVALIEKVWMVCCWPLTFFAARAGIIAALSVMTVYGILRFAS